MIDPVLTFLFGVIAGVVLMTAVFAGLILYVFHRAVTRD